MEEKLDEAMILLDPPILKETSSKLKPRHVMNAYTILISINEGYNNGKQQIMPKEFPWMADVYRALILSSSLLLELSNPKRHDPQQFPEWNSTLFKKDETLVLIQTIRRSILLLRRLGSIFLLSQNPHNSSKCRSNNRKRENNYSKAMQLQQNRETVNSNFDWHDDVLPPSTYPLLQECFVRKEVANIDDDVVFGRDKRLVSLDIKNYSFDSITANYSQEVRLNRNPVDSSQINIVCNNNDMIVQETNRIINDNVSIDFVEIESEQNILLKVAFPKETPYLGTERGQKNSTISLSNNGDEIILEESLGRKFSQDFTKLAKEQDHLPVIRDLFQNNLNLYNSFKSGYLIFRRNDPSETSHGHVEQAKCHLQLFSNGVLVACTYVISKNTNNDNLEAATRPDKIIMFCTIGSHIDCSPIILGNTFYFQVGHVRICSKIDNPNKECSKYVKSDKLIFGIDEEMGGNFAYGYSWVTALMECSEKLQKAEELQRDISVEWDLAKESDNEMR